MPRDTRSKETTASKTKQLYGLSLDASHLILSTLRDVARIAPVPYLMQAAQLALTILDTIQVRPQHDKFGDGAHLTFYRE